MLTRRRRSAIIPEAELQAACALALDQLLMPPAIWFSAGIGALQLSARQAARLKAAGVKPNIPDLLFIYEGLVFGIELKTRRGQLSTTRIVRTRSGGSKIVLGQREGFEALRQAGIAIAVCRSVNEVLSQLQRWGVPTRVSATSTTKILGLGKSTKSGAARHISAGRPARVRRSVRSPLKRGRPVVD